MYKSEFVDRIAVATTLDAAALITIQAIYHDPERSEWTTQIFCIGISNKMFYAHPPSSHPQLTVNFSTMIQH